MYKWTRTARLCSVAAAASAAAGAIAGSLLERKRQRLEADSWRLPCLPTVSAAVPMSNTALVPVPPRPTGLPPEPPKGAGRPAEIMRFGFPGMDSVLSRRDYVVSYDRRNRTAAWVFEHLTKESVRRNDAVDRQKSTFAPDQSVHQYFRSTNEDYKVGAGFNRDKWEHLERHVRGLTRHSRNVYVCTGPLYLPRKEADGKSYVRYQVIGANNVAVPTHFFKVLVREDEPGGELHLESYVLPNQPIPDDAPLQAFMVPPDSVERAAGLLFFERVPLDNLATINGRPVDMKKAKKSGGWLGGG